MFGDNTTPGHIKGLGFVGGPKPQIEVTPGVFESVAGSFNIMFDGMDSTFNFADGGTGDDFAVFTNNGQDLTILDPLINFRSVVLTAAAVPEPSSLAMVAIAALSMVRRRRR
jgi:hypothetical protein